MMLPIYALLLVPLANAWTFRTTNTTGDTEIARGDEEQQCTKATIGKGKLFTWDPEGSSLCVSIYHDAECESRAGYSCGGWRKNASKEFLSFDILLESEIEAKRQTSTLALTPTSTSATETASRSTPPSSSAASVSASATPTGSTAASGANANTGSSSSLSGGAIAGIVIGVIAAVAIVVAFIVIFMRKKNKKKAAAASQGGGYGPHEAYAAGSSVSGTTAVENAANSMAEKETESVRRFRPVPGSRVVELVGDEGSAELGSSPISEMDGHTIKRPFNVV
ncbi:hypothetical protein N7491_009471 [Penicillium cf. griseofulvum]|uniref:Mid2 domain-containing protein n=1 Tax=Penicillium cf. griseofulvum TaxID=2972120 RepID=A0A9W9JPE2_9EURO|nr:hypothetical protein N7472_004935 [Penicillium cf. griseofulvum]KAJ5424255.1 hypothetical protein N7491_009471 [Penicillium cf. griseofulvum]KAJ5442505.1 hypothetical protein N7445_005512 [Penicillium cf. griseofulvum]